MEHQFTTPVSETSGGERWHQSFFAPATKESFMGLVAQARSAMFMTRAVNRFRAPEGTVQPPRIELVSVVMQLLESGDLAVGYNAEGRTYVFRPEDIDNIPPHVKPVTIHPDQFNELYEELLDEQRRSHVPN